MARFDISNSMNNIIEIPQNKIHLSIKREDEISGSISGNKFRKLKYNLIEAKKLNHNTILTFGGAFSNHIAAVANVGNAYGLRTIGIIRGDELEHKNELNATLQQAKNNGMILKFIDRASYRNKTDQSFIEQLKLEFGNFYLLPEGGTNALAVKGCEEILSVDDMVFTHICCPVGTGGTLAGIINSSHTSQKVLGFPALKGDFLIAEISKFARNPNWQLITDYHFGGYAKINEQLISFINQFKEKYNIQLDPIYTGKMMYGIFEMINNGFFHNDHRILAIHTGGLQGIAGINEKLKRMSLEILQ